MKKLKYWLIGLTVLTTQMTGTAMAMAQRPASEGPPPPAWVQLVPFAVMFVVFYFLLIRPQLKQKKDKEQLLGGLSKGAKVVTQGGFIVTIMNINPTTLDVKLNDETRAKILRSSVVDIYSDQADVQAQVALTSDK